MNSRVLQAFAFILFSQLLSCGGDPLGEARRQGPLSQIEQILLMLSTARGNIPATIVNRGIWIVGGTGLGGTSITQIDLYDPDTDSWYTNVTRLPTARQFAGVVSFGGRIFVLGGLDVAGNALTTVEAYDPFANTWFLLPSMPQKLQGFVTGVDTSRIYLLAGTTTNAMATGTIFNQVYTLQPDLAGGSWTTLSSGSTIPGNVDMGGCAINGVLYFNTGRLYNTGATQFGNDAYVMASNGTTASAEAAFSQGRFGAASACYRPQIGDPFPNDPTAVIEVGGSSLASLTQPPAAITPSATYDYFNTIGNANSAGPVLPISAYYPAAEVSYSQRRLYVFGGATSLNIPVRNVYSLGMGTPIVGTWNQMTAMPVPRYGHHAVIMSR